MMEFLENLGSKTYFLPFNLYNPNTLEKFVYLDEYGIKINTLSPFLCILFDLYQCKLLVKQK